MNTWDYDSINRQAYDKNADYYSFIYKHMLHGRDFFRLMEGFAFIAKDKVLDLGCGNGAFVKKLSKYGLEVICLDNSIEMLKKGSLGKLVLASLEDIPLKSGSVGGIFANCSLLHLPLERFPAALKEAKRALRKYGALLITMKLDSENAERIIEESGIKRFQTFYEEKSLASLVSHDFNIHRTLKFSCGTKPLAMISLLCTSKS